MVALKNLKSTDSRGIDATTSAAIDRAFDASTAASSTTTSCGTKEQPGAAAAAAAAKKKAPITDITDDNFGDHESVRNPLTGEWGGYQGAEPTRNNDWEHKGRCTDFS